VIAIGIVAFAYRESTTTTREKVVDIGPSTVSADKTRTLLGAIVESSLSRAASINGSW